MSQETKLLECAECNALFRPDRLSRVGGCCSRRCARIREARHGVPSLEDKKALFVSEMMESLERIFKPK